MDLIGEVSIEAPPAAASDGPVPLRVAVRGDMETYYANDGILDKALEVVVVRADAPGVRFVAKTDPSALWLPDEPIEPDPALLASRATIRQVLDLDLLGFGLEHPGAASYHVLACFARWTTDPVPLRLRGPARSLPWPAFPVAHEDPDALRAAPDEPDAPGVTARWSALGDSVVGAVRVRAPRPTFPGEDAPPVHVSVVIARLGPRGGVHARTVLLRADERDADAVARFAIPREAIAEDLAGPTRTWVFSREHWCGPIERDFGA